MPVGKSAVLGMRAGPVGRVKLTPATAEVPGTGPCSYFNVVNPDGYVGFKVVVVKRRLGACFERKLYALDFLFGVARGALMRYSTNPLENQISAASNRLGEKNSEVSSSSPMRSSLLTIPHGATMFSYVENEPMGILCSIFKACSCRISNS